MSQSDQNETLLVLLTQEGDVAAFEELLRRLYGPLRQYVTRLVGESDADDVLQDAAIRIYKNIRFLREPAVFKAWAFRIATRIAYRPLAFNTSGFFADPFRSGRTGRPIRIT